MSEKYKILWLDNDTTRRSILQIGKNIIGNIHDADDECEATIEPAAIINVTADDQITITPCRRVSCYVKNFKATRWKPVFSNDSTSLTVEDICLLYPVKIWLKVLPIMDDSCAVRSPKRKLEEIIEDEPVDKRCRMETLLEMNSSKPILCNSNHEPLDEENFMEGTDQNENINGLIHQDVIDTISTHSSDTNIIENKPHMQSSFLPCPTSNDEEKHLDVKNYSNSQHSKDQNSDSESVQQNENNIDNPDPAIISNSNNTDPATTSNGDNMDSTTTTSTQNIPREKCKYGDKCYRLNQDHKKTYSHPGDADYDQPDPRPECRYGKQCFRKNSEHKLQYKHTRQRTLRTSHTSRSQSPEYLSGDESFDESIDESEYEPSFIDDDSDHDITVFDSDEDYDD